jgi:hypothetical protein
MASTICFDHMIINIDMALRAIIVPAFLLLDQSVLLTKENTFHASIINRTHSAKYTTIFIKGYAILSYSCEARSTQLIHIASHD